MLAATGKPSTNISGEVDLVEALNGNGGSIEPQRTEELLRVKQEQLEKVQRLAHLGFDIRDVETGARQWSEECYRIFGVSPQNFIPNNDSVLELIHPDDRHLILSQRAELASGICPAPMEYRIIRPDGDVRYIEREWELLRGDAGAPIQLFGTLHDVTAHRRAEEQSREAQTMDAIGALSGGIAHDFNNLLGVIIGNLDLARELNGGDTELQEMVDDALSAALRGAQLTQRLLAFAQRQALRPEQLDVNDLLGDTARLLRPVLGENIEIALQLAESVWPVVVDRVRLEASLASLAANARDAMPEGGRLIVTTVNRSLDAEYAATHLKIAPGDFVMIEISDSGIGMPPEVARQVFEPFFTTKKGTGTGLDLSAVFGFVRQSHGHIAVYSEPGVGSTFRLYFPRVITAAPAADIAPAASAPERGRGETVLIVEDNIALRRAVVRQLQELGYRTRDCDRATAAIEILQHEHIDLLFSDVVMHGKVDGVELAQIAQERWPAVKILLTSGFPRGRIEEIGELFGRLQFLRKPFRRDELAAAVTSALAEASGV